MRRKGRSAGYLFCGARLVPDAQRCTAGGGATFVCLCAEWGRFPPGLDAWHRCRRACAAARVLPATTISVGLGWRPDSVASVSGAGDSRSAILRYIGQLCVSLRQNYLSGQIPPGRDAPPRTAHPAPSKYRCHTARAAKPSRIHCCGYDLIPPVDRDLGLDCVARLFPDGLRKLWVSIAAHA